MTCCVPRCGNNVRNTGVSVSYHEFPCDPYLASKWVRNINVSMPNGGSWVPSEEAKVCSDHFLPGDFRPNTVRRYLKPGSIPTVFAHLGQSSPSATESELSQGEKRKSDDQYFPLIVKVAKPDDSEDESIAVIAERSNSQESGMTNIKHLSPSATASVNSSGHSAQNIVIKGHDLSSVVRESVDKQDSTMFKITSVAGNQLQLNALTGSSPPKNTLFSTAKQSSIENSVKPNLPSTSTLKSQRNVMAKSSQSKNDTNLASSQAGKINLKKSKPVQSHVKNQPPMDLIEIGPSTFLKINPEVITVTQKVTPAGNTILQFAMNPNVAGIDAKSLFQVGSSVHGSSSQIHSNTASTVTSNAALKVSSNNTAKLSTDQEVSTSSSGRKDIEGGQAVNAGAVNEEDMIPDTTSHNDEGKTHQNVPVLLTTKFPMHYSLNSAFEKQDRYFKALKEKNKVIHNLRVKVSKLVKKLEELETKCVVQERQLNFPSMKKLKVIKKNADNGEPHATFILEQIRGYMRNIPIRWSTTTMNQCSVWCRKAPYAYEYFKKANLFRLPAIITVKRYMKNHPEITEQIKNRTLPVLGLKSDDSSSDFEFDETDEDGFIDDDADMKEEEQIKDSSSTVFHDSKTSDVNNCDIVLTSTVHNQTVGENNRVSAHIASKNDIPHKNNHTNLLETVPVTSSESISDTENCNHISGRASNETVIIAKNGKEVVPTSQAASVSSSLEGAVTNVNLNGQEIILQPGNVIQLNAAFCDGTDFGNQYFVIPSTDENGPSDHQYSHPVSFVIQNNDEQNQVLYVTEANTVTDTNAANIENQNQM